MNDDKHFQMILTVPSGLFANQGRRGVDHDVSSALNLLAEAGVFRLRGEVEEYECYRQVATYCLIFHPRTHEVLTYRRSGGDPRLLGSASVGIGGHVEAHDYPGDLVPGRQRPAACLHSAACREVQEEVGSLDGPVQIAAVIRDDSDHVARCHLGFVFAARSRVDLEALPETSEIRDVAWRPVAEALALEGLESWSRICLEGLLARSWTFPAIGP